MALSAIALAGAFPGRFQIGPTQTQAPSVEHNEATKARLQGIVKGIVSSSNSLILFIRISSIG